MQKKHLFKTLIVGVLVGTMTFSLAGCGGASFDASKVSVGNKIAGLSVHDPAIVKDGDNYYIFGSHMAAAESNDLVNWKIFAEGVSKRNPVLGSLFDDMKTFEYTEKFTDGGYAVWAPDVIYNENLGKWVMYYSSSHDFDTSVLCMAVADDVKGPYTYVDTLLYSGFTTITAEKTNLYEICGEDVNVKKYITSGKYNYFKYPNCIDANVFKDKNGKMWFCYGSWSGGIWLLEIDEQTGLLIHPETDEENGVDEYFGRHLIGGLHNSCEGPYIFYNEETDYYYLTVSYGGLTREGGYQIRVFRSKEVGGPYLDTKGETLGTAAANHSEYGLKLMGNYNLPSLKTAYMAPGHNSILQDDDGKMYVIHHQRFDSGSEYHEPRVHQLFMTKNGWPVAAPFAYAGESLSADGYKEKDIPGTWFIVNHGTDISGEIHDSVKTELKKSDFTLEEGTVYMQLTIEGVVYDGVLVNMTDESGNRVLCFMGVSENNETVWAVKYLQD